MMSLEADKYSVELWPLDAKEEERGEKIRKGNVCDDDDNDDDDDDEEESNARVACRIYLEECLYIYLSF